MGFRWNGIWKGDNTMAVFVHVSSLRFLFRSESPSDPSSFVVAAFVNMNSDAFSAPPKPASITPVFYEPFFASKASSLIVDFDAPCFVFMSIGASVANWAVAALSESCDLASN